MSRLAAVHLSELKFGKFGYLKDGFQSCLAHSNPQESIQLQSIKNRIHSMILSHYSQDSRNVIFWRLGYINVQVFLKLRFLDLIRRFIAPSQISNCRLTCYAW